MGDTQITIAIPAYNEEDSLRDTVISTEKVMEKKYSGEYKIIIIDDASHDNTYTIAKEIEEDHNTVSVIRNQENYGKNKSLIHAFQKINNGIICFIDGDNQYFASDLPVLIEKLKQGVDIVCGYRLRRRDPFYRKIMSYSFNQFNRIMFSIKMCDINCGMKGFHYEKFLLCKPQYNNARWFFDTELLARAYKQGLNIDEVQILHRNRPFGRSKVNCMILALETIFYACILKWSFLFKKEKNQ